MPFGDGSLARIENGGVDDALVWLIHTLVPGTAAKCQEGCGTGLACGARDGLADLPSLSLTPTWKGSSRSRKAIGLPSEEMTPQVFAARDRNFFLGYALLIWAV